jgi:hypothetical protein
MTLQSEFSEERRTNCSDPSGLVLVNQLFTKCRVNNPISTKQSLHDPRSDITFS